MIMMLTSKQTFAKQASQKVSLVQDGTGVGSASMYVPRIAVKQWIFKNKCAAI